jgi:hypothetical protein
MSKMSVSGNQDSVAASFLFSIEVNDSELYSMNRGRDIKSEISESRFGLHHKIELIWVEATYGLSNRVISVYQKTFRLSMVKN